MYWPHQKAITVYKTTTIDIVHRAFDLNIALKDNTYLNFSVIVNSPNFVWPKEFMKQKYSITLLSK